MILGAFAERFLPTFSPVQLDAFDAILQRCDPDLYERLTKPEPRAEDSDVMRRLLAFAATLSKRD